MRLKLIFLGAVLLAVAFWIGPPSGASAVPTPLPAGYVPPPPPPPPQPWEGQLLQGLHAPVTATSVATLDVWAESEGVLQHNNPLAASGAHAGATYCLAQCGRGGSPVYAYDSMSDGVAADVAFLYGSNYNGVRAAFQSNAGMMGVWRAVNESKWCAGCQDHLYPVDLYRAAVSYVAPPTPAVPPTVADVPVP